MDVLPDTSALDLAAAIRSREVSPLEVLDACLARVDAHNPRLNAVIWRNDEEARSEARAVGDRLARGDDVPGSFAGVPLPIKDLLEVEGQPAFHGSQGTADTPVVAGGGELVGRRYREAGFVFAGRTNAPEFGSVSVTENLRFGATRNPWDPERTPGGSSGGAAAAVASGMFPVANASDGGGSIRIPASCCGLVGHKPSRGRVPDLVAHWGGLATEGAVTRTVADTAALLDVMAAPDHHGFWSPPADTRPFVAEVGVDPGRLRVGIATTNAFGLEPAPECTAATERAGALLESLGHHVAPCDGVAFDGAGLGALMTVLTTGSGEYDGIDWDRVEPHNRLARDQAAEADAATYAAALSTLQRWSRTVVARFGDEFDVLLTPTMAIEPPPVGLLPAIHAAPDGLVPEVLAMAVYTAPFNVTGQPAVSLPLHRTAEGVPVGVQLVAGPWEDARLVRLAAQLEGAAPWPLLAPGPEPLTGS